MKRSGYRFVIVLPYSIGESDIISLFVRRMQNAIVGSQVVTSEDELRSFYFAYPEMFAEPPTLVLQFQTLHLATAVDFPSSAMSTDFAAARAYRIPERVYQCR